MTKDEIITLASRPIVRTEVPIDPNRAPIRQQYLNRKIDTLYIELRSLAAAPPSPDNDALSRETVEQLRALEEEEAEEFGKLLEESRGLQAGALDSALRRADELIARYEHTPSNDPSSDGSTR